MSEVKNFLKTNINKKTVKIILSSENFLKLFKTFFFFFFCRVPVVNIPISSNFLDSGNFEKNSDFRNPDCSGIAGFQDILCDVGRYCGMVELYTEQVCLETGILELWGFSDPTVFENLTQKSILEKLNEEPIMR